MMTDNPVFCALDTQDTAQASQLANTLSGHIGGLKIGMEFFYAAGVAAYQNIADTGLPIFLDLKLHDIPNTVASAVKALCPLEPAILNVHAAGGLDMMRAASNAAKDTATEKDITPPLMIAVTVLTSLEAKDLDQIGVSATPREQVLRLADLAQQAGMGGVVCSAHEVEALRNQCGADFKLIVPGIRPAGHAADDQKRIMTPEAAMKAGADILVIGRAITQADDPAQAASAIASSLGYA
ncbi:Orotidine 5'-phosphate decarboxylase [alpha proteobacterium IMCC14465]|uniref:Orotidine 5'-phosphate decarboxylase n=1 Tax=alpha proteobacterium IMCC14465 TaxID=1220535 RepID=J9DFP5_9PROT|nr:Orotidine 5'-phosphate decarboxylase [alpha proteobacterium IMCC14465]